MAVPIGARSSPVVLGLEMENRRGAARAAGLGYAVRTVVDGTELSHAVCAVGVVKQAKVHVWA